MLTFEQKLTEIRHTIKLSIAGFKNTFEKFQKKFQVNPTHTLEWSYDAFQSAAAIQVFETVYESISHPDITQEDVSRIYTTLVIRVVRGAKNPPSSTSVPSNLIESYRNAAYAEIVELFWNYKLNEIQS